MKLTCIRSVKLRRCRHEFQENPVSEVDTIILVEIGVCILIAETVLSVCLHCWLNMIFSFNSPE